MAQKHPTHDAGPSNYSGAMWDNDDTNTKDEAKPGAGDDVDFTLNSGSVTLDENTAAVGTWEMTGYTNTLAMAAFDIDSNGDVTLQGVITSDSGAIVYCGGSFETLVGIAIDGGSPNVKVVFDGGGAETVTTNAITLGDVQVNGAGTYTLADALSCEAFTMTAGTFNQGSYDLACTSFELDGGTYEDNGQDVEVAGNMIADAGTLTSTGKWTLTANGNVATGFSNTFGTFATSGTAVAALTGHVEARKVELNGDDVTSVNKALYITTPTAGGWWTQNSTVTVGVAVTNANNSPGDDIVLSGNKTLQFYTGGNTDTVTMDGDINIGTGILKVWGTGATDVMTLDMGSKDLTCGAIQLGNAGATNGNGDLDLGSGTASIVSIAAGNAANLVNVLDFGTGAVTITNAFDTTGIKTIRSGSGVINFTGGLTIDSDATRSTTWTLDGNTKINGDITIQQTAGTTKLDLADYDLHLRYGDTLTRTAGTLTTTNDYQGRIFADGNTLANIIATKWIDVIDGVDGGGNTKLRFIESEYAGNAEASVGCGNMFGLPEVGGPF